jgi:hypothetical protein
MFYTYAYFNHIKILLNTLLVYIYDNTVVNMKIAKRKKDPFNL